MSIDNGLTSGPLLAVEQLIALGADVAVTISQQRTHSWGLQDAPCKLSPHGGEAFWTGKMTNLCLMNAAPEAVYGSLFNLIHLAVCHPDK